MRVVSGMFVARVVTEDTHFTMPNGKTYFIRKGDRVAIYPPYFHKDPEIFEDPEVSIAFLTVTVKREGRERRGGAYIFTLHASYGEAVTIFDMAV